MARSQSTFAKRDREQKRKERAQSKEARRAARKAEVRVGKGPPIEAATPDANIPDPNAPSPPTPIVVPAVKLE